MEVLRKGMNGEWRGRQQALLSALWHGSKLEARLYFVEVHE